MKTSSWLLQALLLTWVLCVYATTLNAHPWMFGYWQDLRMKEWKRGKFEADAYVQLRFYDQNRALRYYQLSQQFAYAVHPHLDAEFHYSFIRSRADADRAFFTTQRLEFELNPHWKLTPTLELRFRQRLELRKRQGEKQWNNRFRFRPAAVFTINRGPLLTISVHNEIFYNITEEWYTENRFVPADLSFKVNDKVSFNVFLMILSARRDTFWQQQAILGTQLSF